MYGQCPDSYDSFDRTVFKMSKMIKIFENENLRKFSKMKTYRKFSYVKPPSALIKLTNSEGKKSSSVSSLSFAYISPTH